MTKDGLFVVNDIRPLIRRTRGSGDVLSLLENQDLDVLCMSVGNIRWYYSMHNLWRFIGHDLFNIFCGSEIFLGIC